MSLTNDELETRIIALEARLAIPNVVPRTLDTDFVIDPLRPALALYTFEFYTPVSLGSSHSAASVHAYLDGLETQVLGIDLTMGLSLGLSSTPYDQKIMAFFVQAGSTVNLTSVLVGNGTVTFVRGQEILL